MLIRWLFFVLFLNNIQTTWINKFNHTHIISIFLFFFVLLIIKLTSEVYGNLNDKFSFYLFVNLLSNSTKMSWKTWFNIKFEFFKTQISFVLQKLNILYYNYKNYTKNIFLRSLLWRPLIKRVSYIGLYANSRVNFLKFFKK